ncbi:MAG: hypothetical protein IPK60_08605 [Sandaracinaceae bacterium]|nr:hypothetical protein [Sandaracinaceae bacterium]
MTKRIAVAVSVLLFCISACAKKSEPALEVQVVTGLVPGPEFASVLTEVFPGTGTTSGTIVPLRVPAVFGREFAQGKSVATFPLLPNGTYTVWVHLYRPNGQILIERRTQIVYSGSYVLRVYLTRDCLSSVITCPEPGGSAEYTECLSGHCVDPRCNPADNATRMYCPSVLFCIDATDCTDPVAACASNECVSGVCTPTQVADTCANQWCNPDLEGGCTPLEVMDGGMSDAGTSDAGTSDAEVDAELSDADSDAGVPDAGVDAGPVCGTFCRPSEMSCQAGMWDCGEATPVCAPTTLLAPGTSCGVYRECDASGTCVTSCEDGAACVLEDSCEMGVFDCASGLCNSLGPDMLLAPGTECGDGKVCTPAGACSVCNHGYDCAFGDCGSGRVDCTSGVATCVSCSEFGGARLRERRSVCRHSVSFGSHGLCGIKL